METKLRRQRKWIAIVLVGALGGVAAAGALYSGSKGAPRAYAEPIVSLSLGYYDQATKNFFSVDADSQDPSPGAFLVAVSGVGVFWSADPIAITEEIDGSLTLSFDGDGYLDDEADIDTAGVFVMDLSGGGSAVEFELSGTTSADRGSASITLEYDSNTYAVSSSPAPETADEASDDVADLLASEGFAALRLLFVDGLAADVDQTTFVGAMEEYFDAFGEVSGAALDGAVTYELNPGPGRSLPIQRSQ